MGAAATLTPAEGKCVLHAPSTHRPLPLRLVLHHVQPQGMGGPDVPANRAVVCDTGHYNVHTILAWLIFGQPAGKPDPGGTTKERAMAQRGYDAWVAAGKPGDPHAAYALHGHA